MGLSHYEGERSFMYVYIITILSFLFSGHNENVCMLSAEQSMDFRDL